MTGPSESAFLATLGASTVATFAVLYLVNRRLLRPDDRPPAVSLGPSVPLRAVLATLAAMLAGVAAAGLGGVAVHRVSPEATLWWIAATLVPMSLLPTLVVARRGVAAAARGEARVEGDALVVTWDGERRDWHLPACTASLRLTPTDVPGAEAALLLVVQGPDGDLPLTFPFAGIPGTRWLTALELPDGWFEAPGGAAFPVSDDVREGRRLVDAVLQRVAAVDRGRGAGEAG